jgi:prephenate dehydrogenase
MTFGIIGYGAFGKLLADVLSEHGEVYVYSHNMKEAPKNAKFVLASFEDVALKDIVILAVNLENLDKTSKKLHEFVSEDTVVMDVCSVKSEPLKILQKNLGRHKKILATHPLFGPQTAKDGTVAGKNIVVCPPDFEGKDEIIEFFKNELELNVIQMSAEEHDKEMAWVHALTFFVGRGLMELNPPKSKLSTGYYQKLLDLVELESSHSIELFNTVQRGNPFATEIRSKFIKELQEIDEELARG